jgi:asparagine synthase (glutamine-hydrolysing)
MQKLDERLSFYSEDLKDLIRPKEYIDRRFQEAISEVPHSSEDTPAEAGMRDMFYLNLTRWMPTLLDRKDRMSMASGLELRVPFCDHRLVEYVWNIPWDMKSHKGREKGLLREALKGILPEDVLWRKKSPYPKTHNPSYSEAISRMTLEMLDDSQSPILPLIDKSSVRALAVSDKGENNLPWFGQLMNKPQLLAFLLQTNHWLKEYRVSFN